MVGMTNTASKTVGKLLDELHFFIFRGSIESHPTYRSQYFQCDHISMYAKIEPVVMLSASEGSSELGNALKITSVECADPKRLLEVVDFCRANAPLRFLVFEGLKSPILESILESEGFEYDISITRYAFILGQTIFLNLSAQRAA